MNFVAAGHQVTSICSLEYHIWESGNKRVFLLAIQHLYYISSTHFSFSKIFPLLTNLICSSGFTQTVSLSFSLTRCIRSQARGKYITLGLLIQLLGVQTHKQKHLLAATHLHKSAKPFPRKYGQTWAQSMSLPSQVCLEKPDGPLVGGWTCSITRALRWKS